MTSIGVIGSGQVGQTLAAGFAKHGHVVTIGSRTPAKLAEWAESAPGVKVGHFTDAAQADIVILAVQGGAAAEALEVAGLAALAGKVVIDTCNPIAGAPVNGILPYFTGPNDALMQRLQALAPDVRFVKAFSCVGSGLMIDPALPGGRPTMFICGNDAAAKGTVTELLAEVGWDTEDAAASRAPAPSRRSASSGARPVFCATTGCTRSRCSRPDTAWGGAARHGPPPLGSLPRRPPRHPRLGPASARQCAPRPPPSRARCDP